MRAFCGLPYPYIPMGRRDKPSNIYGLNENLWPPIKT